MGQRLISLGGAAVAALVIVLLCLTISPGAADWRRLRTPTLLTHSPPYPTAVRAEVDRAWAAPESFNWYRHSETRDGIARDAVIAPPLHVVWASESFNVGIHGASKSSPAVDASGVYVGSDSGLIKAFDLDGKPRWTFRTEGATRGIHSTPILTRHRVYIGSYGGTFYVLDKADGTLIWTFHNPRTAFGSSPFVIDGALVAAIETETLNAFVTALDPRDGQVRWRSPFLGEQIHSSPAYDRATNTLVIGANNKMLFGLDASDGHVRWRTFVGGEVKSTPLIVDGVAYVSSWAGRLHAVEVSNGRVQWEAPLDHASQSSPTLVPGTDVLVVGNSAGSIKGIDRRGGRVMWTLDHDDPILSSAVAARDARGRWRAWMGCGHQKICGIDAGTGRVVDKINLPGQLTGVPVAFDQSLFVSLDFPGGLVRLSAEPPR